MHPADTASIVRRWIVVLCVFLMQPHQASAADPGDAPVVLASSITTPTPVEARAQMTLARCSTPPKLDGKLQDACWTTASHVSGFFREEGSAPVLDQTEAWMCADKARLYVAFHCIDTHPDRIVTSETNRNGSVFNDDHVQIWIDSQNTRRNSSLFVVTARGTQRDDIEGGTPDNIAWAGDWTASTQRVSDGWTCEISIPFALLRYPRSSNAFGVTLIRKLARETTREIWPYLPPAGQTNRLEHSCAVTGLDLPYYAPRPIILPYALATAGDGYSGRVGVDVKYPLTTTMTGVATLFPDFQTVEQDVVGINFTYDEKLVQDRRPFFAEGSNFLPFRDMFYSPRVGLIDGGLKIAGKTGGTSVGVLGTDTWHNGTRGVAAMSVKQEVGNLSAVQMDFVGDNREGVPSNRAAKFEGVYGRKVGADTIAVYVNHVPTWLGGVEKDSKDFASFSVDAPNGHPSMFLRYNDIGPDFVNNLGFNPELNYKGFTGGVEQFNHFDKGVIELYDVGINFDAVQHHTGGFFHNSFSPYIGIAHRFGLGLWLNPTIAQRDQFHDHTFQWGLEWGRKTLYQRGSYYDTTGTQAGRHYDFLSVAQGIFGAKNFSMAVNFDRLRFGDFNATQSVLTGSYRLTTERTISCRVVKQTGGGPGGTNIYVAFSQRARTGDDIFLLLGDPNSQKTRGIVTLKVVRPF